MTLRIVARQADPASFDTPLLVVALPKDAALPAALGQLDERLGGALTRTIANRDFRGGRDETLHLTGLNGAGPGRLLLAGLGDSTDAAGAARRTAAVAARQAKRLGASALAWWSGSSDAAVVEATVVGLAHGAWEYSDLKTPPPESERKPQLEAATILSPGDLAGAVSSGNAIAEGMELARRLAMMPGNLCTPKFLADTAAGLASEFGLSLTVLEREDMAREGMGSFLSVAQGTTQPPKLIALEYRGGGGGGGGARGAKGNGKPVVLVGKGLCFDTGGISIKPAQGMEHMKFDMCGAAGVLGAMRTIARLAPPINVVGLVGSTTNMPSGEAVKPGDVVKAMNGKSIEIINTDAEGRLVLADVLAYAKRYDPALVVDAATLTGACVIALGHTATAVLSPDEALAREVIDAGVRAGEPAWSLPLWDDYKDLIKSDVADVKNSGGRPAGTITAALFLKEFAEGYPWAHLDVAGTAYSESDLGFIPKGPTGVPVGIFVELVRGRAR